MEIDIEVVSDEGDNIQEAGKTYDSFNQIGLHIPYPFLGDAIERDYLPTASAIVEVAGSHRGARENDEDKERRTGGRSRMEDRRWRMA